MEEEAHYQCRSESRKGGTKSHWGDYMVSPENLESVLSATSHASVAIFSNTTMWVPGKIVVARATRRGTSRKICCPSSTMPGPDPWQVAQRVLAARRYCSCLSKISSPRPLKTNNVTVTTVTTVKVAEPIQLPQAACAICSSVAHKMTQPARLMIDMHQQF